MVRARDIGIRIGQWEPGPNNAITDVTGVRVGYSTLVKDGDVRTGVTMVVPFEGREALFAGAHRLNGNGEMTGLEWVRESGTLTSPVGITNTFSVGTVHSALIALAVRGGIGSSSFPWYLPVVAETYDGRLNDISGFHVHAEHVEEALALAQDGPIAEGNVGGGTGMICHGFKGGTGTASRVVGHECGGYTVGVLVQANHGRRNRLAVDGVPVGELIPPSEVPLPNSPLADGAGSIIVIVATDAPLLPMQCDRLAQRASLGIARTGGAGENSSGDLFLAFATGNRGLEPEDMDKPITIPVKMLQQTHMDALFYAVIEATEEAIVNAMLAAETMTGRDGVTAYALEPERLRSAMETYRGTGLSSRDHSHSGGSHDQ